MNDATVQMVERIKVNGYVWTPAEWHAYTTRRMELARLAATTKADKGPEVGEAVYVTGRSQRVGTLVSVEIVDNEWSPRYTLKWRNGRITEGFYNLRRATHLIALTRARLSRLEKLCRIRR